MSEGTAAVPGQRARAEVTPRAASWPDARRWLQLGLAAIWLLDGVLQYQSFMFTKGFEQMLAATAPGNPAVIADPITWAARIIGQHPVGINAVFATGPAAARAGHRLAPDGEAALAASVAWSLAVWWLGEGLGGVLSGAASPVNGAPGAVILYALLAVLLWPAARERWPRAPFVAARPVGAPVARALWLVLWGSLAYFAVTAGNRTPRALHDMVSGMACGEPGWLPWINRGARGLLAGHGLVASVILAVLLAVVAVGVYLPAPLARGTLVLAILVSVAIWVVGQDLGTILAGGATDPNSGPLLVLLALAYWPARAGGPEGPGMECRHDDSQLAPGHLRRRDAGRRRGQRDAAGGGPDLARQRDRPRSRC